MSVTVKNYLKPLGSLPEKFCFILVCLAQKQDVVFPEPVSDNGEASGQALVRKSCG
jgi:hypothetical protein